MKSHVQLIRAITAEFLRRKLKSFSIMLGTILAVTLGLSLWITIYNAWLWLLVATVVFLIAVSILVIIAALLLIRVLRPELTTDQKTGLNNFVDKIERVTDTVHTSKLVVIFRLTRDLLRPMGVTFVGSVVSDSTSLKSDYQKLETLFK